MPSPQSNNEFDRNIVHKKAEELAISKEVDLEDSNRQFWESYVQWKDQETKKK